MFLTGQAKKDNHEEAYPDKYKLSEELLKLEERQTKIRSTIPLYVTVRYFFVGLYLYIQCLNSEHKLWKFLCFVKEEKLERRAG